MKKAIQIFTLDGVVVFALKLKEISSNNNGRKEIRFFMF